MPEHTTQPAADEAGADSADIPTATTERGDRAKLSHSLIYAGVRGLSAGSRAIGVENSIRLVRAASGLYAGLPFNRKRLARAEANLRWCFPDWDEQRAHACAIEAYRHMFTLGVEVMAGSHLVTRDNYDKYVELGNIDEALEELRSGRPCLLVTGHCGNWELLGATIATLGFPMHALYRPMDVKPLDEWLKKTRAAQGIELVDKFGAARRLPQLLESGKAAAFIADQNAGERGLFVPFFNRLASAYKTIGVLAMRYRTPIICGAARRLSGGIDGKQPGQKRRFRYRLEIHDIIRPEHWDEQPDPLFYITARYRRAIEQMVRAAPEQYLWMHRYWKSRPRHERDGGEFPDRLKEKIRALPWITEQDLERIEQRSADDAAELAGKRAKPN